MGRDGDEAEGGVLRGLDAWAGRGSNGGFLALDRRYMTPEHERRRENDPDQKEIETITSFASTFHSLACACKRGAAWCSALI